MPGVARQPFAAVCLGGTIGKYELPSGLDGDGVHVYVFDSGIRHTHKDFGGRVFRECHGACQLDLNLE